MATSTLFAKSRKATEMPTTRINGQKGGRAIDVTVTWTHDLDYKNCREDTADFAELNIRPAYADLFKRRQQESGDLGMRGHFKCPAFKDFFYNCYVLSFPYDLRFRLVPESQSFSIIESSIRMTPETLLIRWGQQHVDTRIIFSLNPLILFDAAVDVLIEVGPAFLHAVEPRLRRLTPIPGAFNIGRWFRPIDFTFEVDLSDREIELAKGDPLLYLRFITPKNESVRLCQEPFNADFSRRALECAELARKMSTVGNNAAQLEKYYQSVTRPTEGQKTA